MHGHMVPRLRLRKFEKARHLMMALIKDPRYTSFEEWSAVLQKRSRDICALDRSAEVDLLFLAKGSELLKVRVHERIIDALPKQDEGKTFQEIRGKLTNLKEEPMVLKADSTSQESLNSVCQIVGKMMHGVPPRADLAVGNDFFAKVLGRLEHLYQSKVGKSGKGALLTGKPGIEYDLAAMIKAKSSKKDVTVGAVDLMRPFRWVLSGEQWAKVYIDIDIYTYIYRQHDMYNISSFVLNNICWATFPHESPCIFDYPSPKFKC